MLYSRKQINGFIEYCKLVCNTNYEAWDLYYSTDKLNIGGDNDWAMCFNRSEKNVCRYSYVELDYEDFILHNYLSEGKWSIPVENRLTFEIQFKTLLGIWLRSSYVFKG